MSRVHQPTCHCDAYGSTIFTGKDIIGSEQHQPSCRHYKRREERHVGFSHDSILKSTPTGYVKVATKPISPFSSSSSTRSSPTVVILQQTPKSSDRTPKSRLLKEERKQPSNQRSSPSASTLQDEVNSLEDELNRMKALLAQENARKKEKEDLRRAIEQSKKDEEDRKKREQEKKDAELALTLAKKENEKKKQSDRDAELARRFSGLSFSSSSSMTGQTSSSARPATSSSARSATSSRSSSLAQVQKDLEQAEASLAKAKAEHQALASGMQVNRPLPATRTGSGLTSIPITVPSYSSQPVVVGFDCMGNPVFAVPSSSSTTFY